MNGRITILTSGLLLCSAIASISSCSDQPIAGKVSATNCAAVDGDTIRCQVADSGAFHPLVRLRLNGIDTPELPTPAGITAAQVMSLLVDSQSVTYYPLNIDRYGRIVAEVYLDDRDLSCYMLEGGYARYVPVWDEGKIVKGTCRMLRTQGGHNAR